MAQSENHAVLIASYLEHEHVERVGLATLGAARIRLGADGERAVGGGDTRPASHIALGMVVACIESHFVLGDLFDTITGTGCMGRMSADVYPDGQFVFINNGDDCSQLTTTSWNTGFAGDLAFEINFTP